ncbi:hypothetical protein [Flagellimonas meridianipacifica]|uniref:Tetratricopeptide repeat protein n=1 Tax=Flagellimonas meridianipacifica TaxID=1080225 RepID=A0A2T0MIR9_9FLAO|nr:hypothetical protein [Allomuricauda pacifica]PRX57480.1 hypothetical protein CLV81_1485 [Allomuricauda pacifica]
MITILTTTEHEFHIKEMIDSVDRLNELVQVSIEDTPSEKSDKILRIEGKKIHSTIDWFDTEPPYLFPSVELSEGNLLAILFYKIGNEQQAFQYVSESDTLYKHLLLATKLKFGYEIEQEEQSDLSAHNKAILHHYGNLSPRISFNELRELYANALQQANSADVKSYTAKHYLNLLLDAQLFEDTIVASEAFLKEAKSEAAQIALSIQWCTARFKNLQLPYDSDTLKSILVKQEECIQYLQSHDLHLNAALLAMEACDVANFLGDFPLAKEHINMAIKTFKVEEATEFLGEAGLKKAHLLYHWSKNGSPQYYKAAINAFQDTLKVFKKDSYPDYFAEIQHSLALIYSEIPAPPDEKPMWTAFCASAFKEALEFYTKETRPYEHAMVCHNYATALMDFPPAKLHNNHEKAYGLFEKALEIRTKEKYPTERALTLLNQLELGWLMHNEDGKEEEKRLESMRRKAEEITSLVTDENLLNRAKEQLERLDRLKTII